MNYVGFLLRRDLHPNKPDTAPLIVGARTLPLFVNFFRIGSDVPTRSNQENEADRKNRHNRQGLTSILVRADTEIADRCHTAMMMSES